MRIWIAVELAAVVAMAVATPLSNAAFADESYSCETQAREPPVYNILKFYPDSKTVDTIENLAVLPSGNDGGVGPDVQRHTYALREIVIVPVLTYDAFGHAGTGHALGRAAWRDLLERDVTVVPKGDPARYGPAFMIKGRPNTDGFIMYDCICTNSDLK